MANRPAPSVLIVEDERIVAKDLQQTLAELGYDAFAIAASCDEAITRATERCPDLVFMDVRIKGRLDGIDTAQILRSRFGVPIIYLTAHADDATLERAKKTEPVGYLLKPVQPEELRSVIEVSLYVHEMERQLRERERWYSTTLRSMADAVIAVDLSGTITFMNPAAESLTGMKSADALGRPIQDVLRLLDPEARTLSETPLETALREEKTIVLREMGLVNARTGAHHVIADTAAPVIDEERVLGAVMVFRDVTDEKRIRRQLERADRLVSLGTMAAGVAHEVNNPLAVVIANASFLEDELRHQGGDRPDADGDVNVEARSRLDGMTQALADIQSAGTRIGRIVADLRAFSRPASGGGGMADVVRAVEWAARSTATELRHRARLVTSLAEVPPVEGDETRLSQVFVNLLINAAHAIPPGAANQNEVGVSTGIDELGRIVVQIRDTGIGIPQEIRDRIFEPFFTTMEPGSGTGLGLSICHGIVASFGGEMQVESQVGSGTTFRVILPPARSAAAEPPRPPDPAPPSLRGRILVVDDEEIVLRAIERILRDHEVVCAPSGRHALAIVEEGETFDLILSDIVMQGMTGIEFYEALRRRDPQAADTVVFLSGGSISPNIEEFLQSVPNVRLEKPIEVKELLQIVQGILARSRRAR